MTGGESEIEQREEEEVELLQVEVGAAGGWKVKADWVEVVSVC